MNRIVRLRQQPFSPASPGRLTAISVALLAAVFMAGCTMPAAPAMTAAVATLAFERAQTRTAVPVEDATLEANSPSDSAEQKATATVIAETETTEATSEADSAESEVTTEGATNGPVEQPITVIPLATPLDDPGYEFSGMAWYGDRLVLLPQYPETYQGQLPTLARSDIVAFLGGEQTAPLASDPLTFDAGGLSTMIAGFEGYEAIAFDGDQAYLTIETRPGNRMLGYVVAGIVDPETDTLQLAPMERALAPVQASLGNMTDETLVIDGERVVTIYEANGVNVNSDPTANVYSRSLEKLEPIPFSNIEYRVTDATGVDEKGRFWAINYFFPGDEKLLSTNDPLADTYGEGPTHSNSNPVERLVEFQIEDDAIRLVDAPPIQLALSPLRLARNWEGLVRLQTDELNGFLVVTDKFPSTILAFVPLPDGRQ